MLFKKIAMEYVNFAEDNLEDMRKILDDSCLAHDSPAQDYYEAMKNNREEAQGKTKKKRRETTQTFRDMITSLILCHNVTPVVGNNNERELQASSPDEVALVKFAESCGYFLDHRTQQEIRIQNKKGVYEEYDILNCFPFTSESKRMGIILRCRKNGLILFYLKGAEVILKEKIRPT